MALFHLIVQRWHHPAVTFASRSKSDLGSCEDEARVELHQHNGPGSYSSGVQYQMGQGQICKAQADTPPIMPPVQEVNERAQGVFYSPAITSSAKIHHGYHLGASAIGPRMFT
jgi:hypothetical protein